MVEFLDTALGLGQKDLVWWQMCLRAILVFFISLVYVRLANKRIFGKFSAFDIVLGVMYGSVMSRAITGTSPFWPTLAAGLTLILMHRMLAALAQAAGHGSIISNFIKGKTIPLAKDGKLLEDSMRAHSVTENDIIEALRTNGGPVDIKKIESACLERSGSISIVMKEDS